MDAVCISDICICIACYIGIAVFDSCVVFVFLFFDFNLRYGQGWPSYWVDIASGLNSTQNELLRGGVVSAWGDEYVILWHSTLVSGI